MFTKIRGSVDWYEVYKALYGLKTSNRDYQTEVVNRLTELGYTRLQTCNCIYIKKTEVGLIIVFDYVDDFIFLAKNRGQLEKAISEFRLKTNTTEPVYNATDVLGLNINRNQRKRIIKISMHKKIEEMDEKFHISANMTRQRRIPMSVLDYKVKQQDLDELEEGMKGYLDADDIRKYMAIVGILIWIAGIRFDIVFVVMYLSWFSKAPRYHHMKVAQRCMEYLVCTKMLPLVLGGDAELGIDGYHDASLGTAPKGRSVVAGAVKLNPDSGAVCVSTTATSNVYLSSFESELDGGVRTANKAKGVRNMLEELLLKFRKVIHMYSDNEAMVNFVKGEGVAKGVRHMELRMWYIREEYKKGGMLFTHMSGKAMPVDHATKLASVHDHRVYCRDTMGLNLLDPDEFPYDWGDIWKDPLPSEVSCPRNTSDN